MVWVSSLLSSMSVRCGDCLTEYPAWSTTKDHTSDHPLRTQIRQCALVNKLQIFKNSLRFIRFEFWKKLHWFWVKVPYFMIVSNLLAISQFWNLCKNYSSKIWKICQSKNLKKKNTPFPQGKEYPLPFHQIAQEYNENTGRRQQLKFATFKL